MAEVEGMKKRECVKWKVERKEKKKKRLERLREKEGVEKMRKWQRE